MTSSPTIRRFSGHLALCALWLQIVLSFGHMHAQDVWGRIGFRIGHDAGAARLVTDHRDRAPAQDQADLDVDGCSICASMALLGSALLPDAVKLAVPSTLSRRQIALPAALVLADTRQRPFQPRAPPKN